MTTTLVIHLSVYCISFILVWLGAGLVVSTINDLSKSWKLPIFTVSFFVLGLLTSLPEITIGTIAVLNNDPAILAGNMIGGVIVLFLAIIPLLGIVGKGIHIPRQLDKKKLIFILLVVMAPTFLIADQRLSQWEAGFLVILYISLFVFFSFRQSFLEKAKTSMLKKKRASLGLLGRATLGMMILVGASNQIVNSTSFFASALDISPFFVSLVIVALGTNIPEISIIFRSVISNGKEIALADYLGSASANTLIFGVLTLIHGQTIVLQNPFAQRFIFLTIGLVLFFVFARSKNTLSRKESLWLFGLYCLFFMYEIWFVTAQK